MGSALFMALIGLAAFALSLVLWIRAIRNVAIPDNRLGFIALWAVAFLLGVYSFFQPGANWASGIVGAIATLGGGLFCVLYALNKQGADNPIEVGSSMPAFVGTDDARNAFDSTELAGNPVLIKFFRGHW
ncbi:MAG: hypothetical protein HKN19_15200 [Halioglobus sp.]|nr:hypothetical protein [Halioglobus sp.]